MAIYNNYNIPKINRKTAYLWITFRIQKINLEIKFVNKKSEKILILVSLVLTPSIISLAEVDDKQEIKKEPDMIQYQYSDRFDGSKIAGYMTQTASAVTVSVDGIFFPNVDIPNINV